MFPMMEQMFPGKDKPFKPDEIAKLCTLYEHKIEDDGDKMSNLFTGKLEQ